MKKLRFFFLFLLILLLGFAAFKTAFMLFNGLGAHGCTVADVPAVLWHGLSLDLAVAGYLMAPVFLLLWLSRWVTVPRLSLVLKAYACLLAVVISLISVADICLYSFWDFKIDATIFAYLDSPRGAMASVSALYLILAFLAVTGSAALLCLGWFKAVPAAVGERLQHPRLWSDAGCLLAAALMFLCIRGGVGRSTANVGMVYYSSNQYLNHAAVNPAFSLLYSLAHPHTFKNEGNYMPAPRCRRLFEELGYNTRSVSPDTLLTTRRPDILLIILEGMGGTFVEAVGGEPGVTPRLNSLAREGVLFDSCYANSYRTDRGTVCLLSGAPSFPRLSLMKMPEVSRRLPSIAASLGRAGYDTHFLYGGDINFTNMQSYLRSTGYTHLTGDTRFTPAERLTHGWGVTDRITFRYLWNELKADTARRRPRFTTFLTLASHEPWGVPYNRIPGNAKANAMAYTDSCLGELVDSLRRSPLWKNLLLICVPDHGIGYPAGLTEANPRRYHIPMVWAGGAVRAPRRVSRLCNQTDLAATLLGQLGLPHHNFPLSRDVLSGSYTTPFAFHTFDNGFSVIDSTGFTVFDLTAHRPLSQQPDPSERRINVGKAYLQTCYRLMEAGR